MTSQTLKEPPLCRHPIELARYAAPAAHPAMESVGNKPSTFDQVDA
jgi:hypothetical protein